MGRYWYVGRLAVLAVAAVVATAYLASTGAGGATVAVGLGFVVVFVGVATYEVRHQRRR